MAHRFRGSRDHSSIVPERPFISHFAHTSSGSRDHSPPLPGRPFVTGLDLRLYLVTDSTPSVLGDRDLCHVVEEAIKGGVTIVQYRDKHADTGELINTASKLLRITKRHKVPLLINDRPDIAIAVGADGVHIGQGDMQIDVARTLIGKTGIIGVTVSTVQEAVRACAQGADYLGIGTVFATPTKKDTKTVIGTAGTAAILQALGPARTPLVAIGGINASNVQRVILESTPPDLQPLDGVAVVSAVIAADDPQTAATKLLSLSEDTRNSLARPVFLHRDDSGAFSSLVGMVPGIVKKHAEMRPLCHNMTNLVVQNFAANVCIAAGSSPIMSNNGNEAHELARHKGALVINMGTVTSDSISNYVLSIKAYNAASNPILFDPVGGGATTVRKQAIAEIMAAGHFDIIKGNESEIAAVLGKSGVGQKGVDSGPSSSTHIEKKHVVQELARREQNIVLMTGAQDLLSDGRRTLLIGNGVAPLGQITGGGCGLGSIIASYLAAFPEDKLTATLAAIMHYEIAAERAHRRQDVRGPGTFVPAFLDELYLITHETLAGNHEWCLNGARVWMFSD